MPGTVAALPARHPDLVVRALGSGGQCVVKDPRTGSFFNLGQQELFLLDRLDGKETADSLREAFADEFGEPLSAAELDEFLELVERLGFVPPLEETGTTVDDKPPGAAIPGEPVAGCGRSPVVGRPSP